MRGGYMYSYSKMGWGNEWSPGGSDIGFGSVGVLPIINQIIQPM